MSSDFQNRLRKNLERPVPAEHPAPDVLNAYIEKVLTPAEERQVTEHLAACGECREVVFLATGAAEEPMQPVVAPVGVKRVRWWAWALPVATVAVVASAVLLNQRELSAPKSGTTQIAQARRDEPQAAPSPSAGPPAEAMSKSEAQDKGKVETDFAAPKKEAPAQPAVSAVASPASPAEHRELAKDEAANRQAENEIANGRLVGGRAAEESKPSVAMSAPAPAADRVQSLKQAQAPPAMNANGTLRDNEPAFAAGATTAEVQTQDTVSKAKTANLESKTARTSTYAYSGALVAKKADIAPLWRVTAEGSLEHLDLGKWQPALADSGSHFLAVGTFLENIWAGGKNLALYHSADNGVTWERQTLRVRIAADIVQIQFTSAKDGALTTNLGTSFVTHDGGKSWGQEK